MQPLAVLVVMPVLVGLAAELVFRDTTRASLAAALASSLAVYACLATVLTCFGYLDGRHSHRKRRHA